MHLSCMHVRDPSEAKLAVQEVKKQASRCDFMLVGCLFVERSEGTAYPQAPARLSCRFAKESKHNGNLY